MDKDILLKIELPKGWAKATISEMISADGVFVDGDWIESKDQDQNGDVRLIQLADIGDGDFRDKSSRFLTLKRANEIGLNTWSFGLGFQNEFAKHFMWDGGISFMRNGESYSFLGTDTAYSYQTTYSYITMPLRVNYVYGKDFKFYAGAGLIPQMFMGYKQERQWTRADNSDETETIKSKNGYNSFVISAVMNVGMMVNFNNGWSLLVSPEARFQLNSSYMKQDAYIHKGRAYGVTFGLVRHL